MKEEVNNLKIIVEKIEMKTREKNAVVYKFIPKTQIHYMKLY